MYFVAIVLPQALDQKVLVFKKQMQEQYECKVGLKSPAHITLISPFWLPDEKEASFVSHLQALASQVQPFSVSTANFSAFKPRTLFVAVGENAALQELKNRVDKEFVGTAYNIKNENRPFHPHITIATRDLRKSDFAACWPQFAKLTFAHKFEATGISVLRHNGQSWEVIETATFQQSVVSA